MKILIDGKINNCYSIAMAGGHLGINCLVLNNHISVFDAFDKFMPDIVIYKEKCRAMTKCLDESLGILTHEYKEPEMFFDIMDVPGAYNSKYGTDIIYLHTQETLPKEIYNLCYKNYKIKIFGNYVRLAQYCGQFPGNDVICSAKLAIDSGGILPKFIRNKVFTITKYQYPIATPTYENQAELEFLINTALSSPEKCEENTKILYKECIKYSPFHVLQKILKGLKIECKIPNEESL